MRIHTYAVFAAALALGACQTTTATNTAQSANAVSRAPVSTTAAIAELSAICGASLPEFGNAEAKLKSNGFTQASTGTWYKSGSDLSVKIKDGPGAGKSCSLVFGTKDNGAAYLKALSSAFPKMGNMPPYGNVALYKNTGAIVLIDDSATESGGVSYFNLTMLSDRK